MKRKMEPNFLLVMPRIVQYIGEGYIFPLGLPYISASLKSAGYNVTTINLNHYEGDEGAILRKLIDEHDINIVGTGGLSPQYHIVKHILKEVKSIDLEIITIVGCGIISADPIVAMTALEYADYGVKGDAEITICEFANAIRNGLDLKTISGLVLPFEDTYFTTTSRITAENQDSIPWPDYEGFELARYLDLPSPSSSGLNAKRVVNMMIGRSCPYQCTFCFRSEHQKYTRRSLDDFFANLDYLIASHRVEHISIIDELFLPKAQDLKEFCERMKKYDVTWDADFSIRNIKFDLLPLMKESGLTLMQFGLESADDTVLESMKKGFTVKKMEEVLDKVHAHEIPIFGAFIFGDIAETAETADRTLQWWHDHKQYLIHLTLMKTYPGTAIYHYACKNGIIKDKVKFLKDGCPQVNISKMTDYEFSLLARKISDASDSTLSLNGVELLSLNAEYGGMTIQATCPVCSKHNKWSEVKLFSINYLACDHCAQKFHIPMIPSIRANIEKNVEKLLRENPKIAVWGMTLSAMDLFKNKGALASAWVYPVDISSSKQGMNLYGKRIYGPAIIDDERITCVIIAVPFYAAQISQQIKENYPHVDKIIDICELIGESQFF